jgi:serine/threonine-protein kinase
VSKLSDVWGYNGSTLAQVIYGYATTNTTGSFTMTATWFYYTASGEQVFAQSTTPLSGSTSYSRVRFDSGTPPQGNCLTYGVHLTTNPAAANGTVTETWKGTCIG